MSNTKKDSLLILCCTVNLFQFGETALILACKTRAPIVVRKLLSKGANPNICNKVSNKRLQ